MKNSIIFLALTALSLFSLQAQRQLTRTGTITFFSHTPIEDIEATNTQVTSIISPETGEMAFAALMKSFQFEKALMQEHFNEKYVHSDKFPKATFSGKITNLADVNFAEDGTYPVTVAGDLTIHGITKAIETEGTIEVKAGKIQAQAKFPIVVADFDIKIPSLVEDNIAKEVEASILMQYEPQG